MPDILIHTWDAPDSLAIRTANRDAHLAWVTTETQHVKLLSGGPWLDDDGQMAGSLLVVRAPHVQAVRDWLAHDPYVLAGLTARTEIAEYKWLLGRPEQLET